MADDLIDSLRIFANITPDTDAALLTHRAADEIERLRAEAVAFAVRPDEVLVVIAPKGFTPADVEELKDRLPAQLRGRVVVIGGMEARRG